MKQDYCHISVILDESGSMNSILNDTIGGFNAFLKTQKDTPGEATFSLTTFNTASHIAYSFKDIQDVEELTKVTYRPGGMTALYDAIGQTISGCGQKLAMIDSDQRPEKVIIVILTDGEENSSREFSFTKIQEMTKEQSDKYNWEFVFLGANLDAEAVGSSLGIKAGNSMTFAANSVGVGATFTSMGTNLSSYRSSSADTVLSSNYKFFTPDDKVNQKQAGV